MRRPIKRYKSILLIFCVLLQSWGLLAQDQRIADKLTIEYKKGALVGEKQLRLLNDLSFNEIKNIGLSLKYAGELIELSKKYKNDKFLFNGHFQIGNCHKSAGDLDEALKAYIKSSEIAIKNKKTNQEGSSYMAIADVYSVMGNSNNAELYYNKSISILREGDDLKLLASALLNAGDGYFHNKNYDAALTNFEESGRIFKKIGYLTGSAYNLGNIGMVFAEQGKDELAQQNMNEAIAILEKLQDYYPISVYLTYLADIYAKKNDLPAAIGFAEKSLHLATSYGLKDQISEANLKLSDLNAKAGNYPKAYNFFRNHIAYRDSVFNIKTVEKMADMRTDYEVSQKQVQVDLLNQQKKNQRIVVYATILAAFLITLLAFGIFKRYRFIKTTNIIIQTERTRSDQLLLNILPEETALELKNNGKVQAKRFESVSVMFTDFKGFSQYAEHLPPEVLVESIDYYFTKFDTIIESYGLEKIKTVGDSYMCAAGLPFPIKDHALIMVKAAMEIADFVNTVKIQNPDSKTHYDIRIGINSGRVVAGVVGSKKFAYDIWGDAVNIASRLETCSEPGKINISEFTYEQIKDVVACDYRGEIKVKNRGMLKMYFINQPQLS